MGIYKELFCLFDYYGFSASSSDVVQDFLTFFSSGGHLVLLGNFGRGTYEEHLC